MKSSEERTQPKRYHGVVVPMITPFTPGGELDEPAVRRIVEHLIEGGVAGVFVLGTTGEEASLSMPSRAQLVDITVEQVKGRAAVYAGISHNCLASSVELATTCRQAGVDVLVARLPTYYALNGDEQRAYFEALIERIPGPLMLYNISGTTHMTTPLDVVAALSHHPKVVGIKDSDNDLPRLEKLLEQHGSRRDFSILVGVTSLSAKVLSLGADGLVPSLGNLVPDMCQGLYEGALQGNSAAVDVYQRKLDDLAALLRSGYSLAQSLGRFKSAMDALSLCGPSVLPPLQPLSQPEQAEMQRAFLQWRAGESA